jgi:cobalt/nickel transport system permease protein
VIDPRGAIVLLVTASLIAACLRNTAPVLAAFGLAFAFTLILGVPIRKIISRLGLIAVSLLPFVIAIPFSDAGPMAALLIAVRAMSIGLLALAIVNAVPFPALLAGARSLGMPSALLNVTMLAQRYFFVLQDELRRLRIAWRARGFVPRTSVATYRTYANGLGALLVRAGSRGERVHAAMQARGFDGSFKSLVPLTASKQQIAFTFLMLAAFAGLLAWDRLT